MNRTGTTELLFGIDTGSRPLRARVWALRLLAWIFSILAVIVGINVVVDSYGIMRTDFSSQVQEPNKNYLKVKYLLGHKDRFDSYLFGSSRVNTIDVTKIPGGKYYNMTYSEGLPEEHLENIRFLLKHGVRVKNVVIGLEDFSYRVDPAQHADDLLRQPYPGISGKSWLTFYGEYYLKKSRFFRNIRDYVRQNVLKEPPADGKRIVYDIFGTGMTYCLDCDRRIEADPAKHAADPRMRIPFHYGGNDIDKALTSIRGLVALARQHHFRLLFFFDPIYEVTYLDSDLPLMMRFKKELAAVTDYYDFSGLNTITTNSYYFHDTKHFRGMVGDMMLRRMFGMPKVAVPADFGVLVTRRNVDEHIALLERQLRERELKLKRKVLPKAVSSR
jgi:hypothetical protein